MSPGLWEELRPESLQVTNVVGEASATGSWEMHGYSCCSPKSLRCGLLKGSSWRPSWQRPSWERACQRVTLTERGCSGPGNGSLQWTPFMEALGTHSPVMRVPKVPRPPTRESWQPRLSHREHLSLTTTAAEETETLSRPLPCLPPACPWP